MNLAAIATCCFLALSACGAENSSGSEGDNPAVEATIGEVDGVFDYVDPAEGEAAVIPGVDLHSWVSALEQQGVAWLEEGSESGAGLERWLGVREPGFTAAASVYRDEVLVEFSCTITQAPSLTDAVAAVAGCYGGIDTEGFDATEVSGWIERSAPVLGGDQYSTTRFEVFGPIWMMLTAETGEDGSQALTVIVRRASA